MQSDVMRFIVAEVSKNWINGESVTARTLGQQFEVVIEVNRLRGYRLHSFDMHRLMTGRDEMNETIIAVFVLEDGEAVGIGAARSSG